MMEDELIKIWQSSPKVEQVKFEKSRLMLDMDSSLNRFHRLVKYSILSEQIAVFVIIPAFLFGIYFVPPILTKIASLFIAIWAIWYMFLLRKFKKSKPDAITRTYLEYLKENRSYIQMIKKWGDTALYWYILPPLAGCILFILGHYLDGLIDDTMIIKLTPIFLGTFILTYILIRWVVKKIYAPRLKKIDELIKVMESQN